MEVGMVARSNDEIARSIMQQEAGMKLAREALAKADYTTAWKHVQAYDLSELDVMELGLPESHRPTSLRGRGLPKAMGCVG
ncbi:MAG TPA: hypothetical protein VJB97_00170 [Candidatus Paceibacterota bacterium]